MTVVTPIGGPNVVVPLQSAAVTTQAHPTEHGVTRYLCCAMQLDARLTELAVEYIVEEPRRAVAPSPGVDLSCVLAYALAARRRQITLNWLLALLLVLTAIGAVVLSYTIVILGLLLAWALVTGELFYVFYGVIARKLTRGAFDPNAAPTPTSSHQVARLQEIARHDRGNVTVFSGFAPFAGYGNLLEAWSFAVRTDTPKEEADHARTFEVHALYDHIAAAVEKLRLPGVRIGDRLFVNGEDLRSSHDVATSKVLLPNAEQAPVSDVPPKLIRDLRENGSGRARPYLTLQVSGWEGELVLTQFLRFTLLPHEDVLFVENSTTLLAPVRAIYRTVDTLPDRPTFHHAAMLVSAALPRAVGLLFRSIPATLASVRHAFSRKDVRQLREIRHRSFNYGTLMSIREAASDHLYYRYYQKIDREMYAKVVTRRVLDSLIEFLDLHDIDTSELRERQTTIYNNGLYVGANASVSVSQSAVAAGRNAVGRVLHEAGIRVGGGPAGQR
jgi:hypothetical protein